MQNEQFTTSSFIVDRAGRAKKLVSPGVDSTVLVSSLNDLAVIVGQYGDYTNTRGFVLRDGVLTTVAAYSDDSGSIVVDRFLPFIGTLGTASVITSRIA